MVSTTFIRSIWQISGVFVLPAVKHPGQWIIKCLSEEEVRCKSFSLENLVKK